MKQKFIFIIIFKILAINILNGQNAKIDSFFKKADTLDKKRLKGLILTGAVGYTGATLLLNNVWYKQYPRSKFHTFDDNGEWENMDKYGHVLTAYVEAKWAYDAFRWTGMRNRNAALWGMASATLFQTTLETLDGFSANWGFSWGDVIANTSGCALFGVQQAVWNEQRIVLKVGNFPKKYSKEVVTAPNERFKSVKELASWLYGTTYPQTFFKDYNAINWWVSINPHSFAKNSTFPSWLNIALGHSAENVFGAYGNYFPASDYNKYPRYRQYLLSLDIDLTKIKTNNKVVKALCRTFNFVKIPAPALEYNSLGKWKVHPLMF
jgi:hypothetical protein